MAELDILSIGSWTIFDHIYRMSRYPGRGDTVPLDMPIERLDRVYFGDCSANVASVAAKLGLNVALGMVVGEDFVTSGYKDHLEKLGVNLLGVEVLPEKQSGHSYLYFDPAGDGFCLSHLGLAENQSDWAVPEALIRASRAVVINEKYSPYTLSAIHLAKNHGAITAINGMVGTAGDDATDFLIHADILFIAESELNDLLTMLKRTHIEELHQLGPETVFVTRGNRGSRVYHKGIAQDTPIVTASSVVDTTGAGDAYVGGTMAALLRGYSHKEAARIGAAASSFVIEDWGCQTNLPTWNNILTRLKDTGEEIRE